MWVSKQHYALMQEQLAQAQHGSDDRLRDRDTLIESLNKRIDELQAQNRELTETMLNWQRERMKPAEPMPAPEPTTWEERLEREMQDMRQAENENGQSS